eukprot:CAMPEP_0114592390 /NCGR_PEP_ID=MMETSP0125-20121206/14227_1 /TAXON_ID=485358 ORGANISM="Aristerostoma sp., Strain ATCC 50986" /NCGR_SAMPLE_ID=MMETSP0125 /ASSEMBLY_ACC=CAM_ASM_000245 /LENGTH=119 /DNA_ID=CAMNT_0001791007 /DNA_START=225 /DNA_END=584 /DNA_ORIENTATION=-
MTGKESEIQSENVFFRTEQLKELYEAIFVQLNNFIQRIRKTVLLVDLAYSVKFIVVLFFITQFAWLLGDFGVTFLVVNGIIAFPVVMQMFGTQITQTFEMVNTKVDDTLHQVFGKIKKD